jgi:hypothetical protein
MILLFRKRRTGSLQALFSEGLSGVFVRRGRLDTGAFLRHRKGSDRMLKYHGHPGIHFGLVLALLFLMSLSFSHGCSSNDDSTGTVFMTADLKNLIHKHGIYFSLDYQAQSIEIGFNKPLNPESVPGNIDLYDKDGTLSENYGVEVDGIYLDNHTYK